MSEFINAVDLTVEQIEEYRLEFERSGEEPTPFLCNITSDKWLLRVKERTEKRSLFIYALVNDGRVIGTINFRPGLKGVLRMQYGDIGYSIVPSMRKRGCGKKLLKFMLNKCKELGNTNVIISCMDDNIASIELLKRFNAKKIKEYHNVNTYEVNCD